jgi:hypothetical protein
MCQALEQANPDHSAANAEDKIVEQTLGVLTLQLRRSLSLRNIAVFLSSKTCTDKAASLQLSDSSLANLTRLDMRVMFSQEPSHLPFITETATRSIGAGIATCVSCSTWSQLSSDMSRF